MSNMEIVANRGVLHKQFLDGQEKEEGDTCIPAPWMDTDVAGLLIVLTLIRLLIEEKGKEWQPPLQ